MSVRFGRFNRGARNGLGAVISYVLKNPDIAQKKIHSAYEKVKDFTWEKRAKSIIQFISEQSEDR